MGRCISTSRSHFPTHFTQFRITRLASACARVLFPRYLVSCVRLGLITPPLLEYANHEKIGTSARCQRAAWDTSRCSCSARSATCEGTFSASLSPGVIIAKRNLPLCLLASRDRQRGYDRENFTAYIKSAPIMPASP